MKRSGARKSKSATGQRRASSSPTKASASPAKASSTSSPAKASSSPAKASVGSRQRKRPTRKSPDDTTGNSTPDRLPENPSDPTSNPDDSRANSPDPNCSICLCKMEDKSFTHSCFHMFCFTCLLEWSKIKAECPLCKQSFKSIIHNIRSESDYDVHHLRDTAPTSPPSLPTPEDVQIFPFLFGRTSLRPWTPILSPIDLQLLADLRNTAHGVTRGFYSDEAFHIFQHMEGRNQIYRDERWARDITLPPGLTYRNVSPEYFTASAGTEYFQRVATWLDRELATLSRHNINMRSHVRDYILHLLQRFDVRSVNFYAEVEPFFGSQTRLFVNQLHNFVRSPLTIRETDHQTVYSDRPPTPPESEVITLDRDDSDIEIVLSPIGTNPPFRGRHNDTPDPFFGLPSPRVIPHADEIPPRANSPIAGPSGLLPRIQASVIPDRDIVWDRYLTDLHEVSDSESTTSVSHGDDNNEILVVGFDKPWRARSPISLSSDGSDIEVDEGCAETSPGSTRKSGESEIRPQEGPDVNTKQAVDVEPDAGSRAWSEFSPDALSEISSGGSFDKSLDFFLRGGHSPFVGFERRFLPEASLEVFCSHDRPGVCELCKEEDAVVIGSEAPTENSFLPRRRKRNRDDCGDSGVVVDVEQFGENSEEPPAKKSTYKKHYRGHKKSANRPEDSLESDGNQTSVQSEEVRVGSCQTDGISAALELAPGANNGLSGEVSEGAASSVLEPESSLLHASEEPMDTERERAAAFVQTDTSSISTCDHSNGDDTKSSSDSSRRSLNPANKDLGSSGDSTTSSTVRSGSLESSRVRDDLEASLHSVESIDSDDSVQWLDAENPMLSVQLRKRHISIGSNESFLSSDSVGSVVLQLSDEEEEEEDGRHVEGFSTGLGGGTPRPSSPQSSSLASFGAARDSSGHSVDDAARFNGVKLLEEYLEDCGAARDSSGHSVDGAARFDGVKLLEEYLEDCGAARNSSGHSVDDAAMFHGAKRLEEFLEDISNDFDTTTSDDCVVALLSGNEVRVPDKVGNGVECLPGTSQGAVQRDSDDDDDVLKCENVPNRVCCDEKVANGVECFSESSESTLEGEFNENGIQKSGNVVPSVEAEVNSMDCASESSESEMEDEFGENTILESGNVAPRVETPVNGVDCVSEASESTLDGEFCENAIQKSGNVMPSIETIVNGAEYFSESSESTLEGEFSENGTLESENVDHSVETSVNGIGSFSDEVDLPGNQSHPFTLFGDISGIQTRTSGSFDDEGAFDRAITKATILINGNKKLKINDTQAVDESF